MLELGLTQVKYKLPETVPLLEKLPRMAIYWLFVVNVAPLAMVSVLASEVAESETECPVNITISSSVSGIPSASVPDTTVQVLAKLQLVVAPVELKVAALVNKVSSENKRR